LTASWQNPLQQWRIGIAIFPDHGDDKKTLRRSADAAMYQVKNNNRNNFKLFKKYKCCFR
jgi:GGDEF domain-containing protein